MTSTQVQLVRDAPATGRKTRSPKHTFNVSFKPWQIQPFMIAPVLPGETMSTCLIQGICRSDPLKSDQLGWWVENYFFYVKHRDLVQRDQVTQMHLDPATPVANLKKTNGYYDNPDTYTFPGGMDWVTMCRDVCIAEYFRDEDEEVLAASIDQLPIASMNIDNFMDSAIIDSLVEANDHELPGENPALPDQGIPAGFEAAYAHWEHMRALNIYAATFEDYLKSFGVSPARELKVNEIHRPELIRYVREWQYPQVKFDAESGAAAPQIIANISERADKDRFFAEPGFIIGLAVVRPKVYVFGQAGAGVGMLDNAYSWLPAVLDSAPYTSLKKFPANSGPTPLVSEDYWVDVKDLFMHGDQFVTEKTQQDTGMATAEWGFGKLRPRFATKATLDNLFKATTATKFRYEGVVSLGIKSRLRDTSL